MLLVASFLALVEPLGSVMTKRTFRNFCTLLGGWLFARRSTVTAMLGAADVAGRVHHARFHRVFSAACWCIDALGLAMSDLPITPVEATQVYDDEKAYVLPVLPAAKDESSGAAPAVESSG